MKTIVALVDFSNATAKLLDLAQKVARAFGSHLILLHVVPPKVEVIGFVEAAAVAQAPSPEAIGAHRKSLEELCGTMAGTGLQVTAELSQGIPVEHILKESQRLQADLIIMGSRHHSALYDLFVGSVTHDVLRHASCPVLVVPGDDSGKS